MLEQMPFVCSVRSLPPPPAQIYQLMLEVLKVAMMKSTTRRFGGTHCSQLLRQKISHATNQKAD
jgi:hypothetical protein